MNDLYKYYKEKYPRNFDNSCISFECGGGWRKLLDKIFEVLKDTDIKVHQVKEKFGGLRFYTSEQTPALFSTIKQAELDSFKTCEDCGTTDKVTTEGSWLLTLCKSCRSKLYKKNKN